MMEARQKNALLFPQYLLLSGSVAAVSKILFAPLEKHQIGTIQSLEKPTSKAKKSSKDKGFLGLWKLSTAGVLRYSLIQALNFSMNEMLKIVFFNHNSKTDFWKFLLGNLASGAIAGALSFCILAGVQVRGYKNDRPDTVKNLYPNLYVKLPQVLLHGAIYFGGYAIAKEMIFSEEDKSGIIGKYLIAQGVTLLSQIVNLPLIIAKGRYESQLLALEAQPETLPPVLSRQMRQIYSEEGVKGLWKGFGRSLPGLIVPALTLAAYDVLKSLALKGA